MRTLFACLVAAFAISCSAVGTTDNTTIGNSATSGSTGVDGLRTTGGSGGGSAGGSVSSGSSASNGSSAGSGSNGNSASGSSASSGGSVSSGGSATSGTTGYQGTTGGIGTSGGNVGGTNAGGTSGRDAGGRDASGSTGTTGGFTSGGMGGRDGGSRIDASNTGGGGTTGTGGGDGGTYHPCPTNGQPCKILPLGDSITWGIQYDGAYRVELFSKAVMANKKITYTGSLSNGPNTVAGMPFPKNNEGHSGWTIDQDASLVPSPAFNTIPDIVLLHIGTNDVYAASGQSGMAMRLGSLLDKITAAAPNALVVVAKIVPLKNSNAALNAYNDAIPGVVATRVAAGKHIIVVDMFTGFVVSSMLSSDGVHPNQTGYNFMGDVFYAAIESVLP